MAAVRAAAVRASKGSCSPAVGLRPYHVFFSQPGDFRSFELVIEGKSIFVNAHCLGQLSSFFAGLCFKDFKEKKEQKATIGGETFENILTLVSCVHPSDLPLKPITVDNFVLLARLADKYQIKLLLDLCEAFIKNDKLSFDYTQISEPHLLAMLRAVVEFRVGKGNSAMVKLLDRAAMVSVTKLTQHKAHTWLPGKASAALFLAARENELAVAAAARAAGCGKHKLRESHSGRTECDECEKSSKYKCTVCKNYFCGKCAKNGCSKAPKTVAVQPTAAVYKLPVHLVNEAMLE